MQLAVAIAGNRLQPAVVHPLSLNKRICLCGITPTEADRLIKRRARLEELIQSLEPPETRQMVHPIVV